MSPRSAGRGQSRPTTPSRRPGAEGASSSSQRRAEIVEIAARLFAEKGFLATTIRDIAEEANILSGSLYHHFSSKESLADEILAGYWGEVLHRYDEVLASELEPPEALRELVVASVRLLEPYEFALRTMLNDWNYLSRVLPHLRDRTRDVEHVWTGVLRAGQEKGQFQDTLDPVLAYRTMMASINGAARWFRPGGALGTEELAQGMADLLLGGVVTRPRPAAATPARPRPSRRRSTTV